LKAGFASFKADFKAGFAVLNAGFGAFKDGFAASKADFLGMREMGIRGKNNPEKIGARFFFSCHILDPMFFLF
jgi:hypothetical protein